jgi:hypothetical protein
MVDSKVEVVDSKGEVVYKVLVPMIQVRTGVAMDSPKLCTLAEGEVFVVIEQQTLSESDGLVRLQLKEGGWTSLTFSKDHSKALVQQMPPAADSPDQKPLETDSAPSDFFSPATSLLLQCTSNQQAIDLLLGSLWLADHNLWFTAAAADGATFERLVLEDYIQTEPPLQRKENAKQRTARQPSTLFASHLVLELPDNPPRKEGPRSTTVHRFVVRKDVEENLRQQVLYERAKTKACSLIKEEDSHATEGVRVSNIGGYHSAEEMLTSTGASQWCPLMMAAVSEALLAMNKDATRPRWLLSGWLNASDELNYNALHSHGAAEWSFVYFVLPGDAPVPNNPSGGAGGVSSDDVLVNDSGCLLLRTQLVPFTQQYGFLSIGAAPGELWAFPGHLFHAVMPRKLYTDDGSSRDGAGLAAAESAGVATESSSKSHAAGAVTAAAVPPPAPTAISAAEAEAGAGAVAGGAEGQRITIACNAVLNDFGLGKGHTVADVKILRALAEVKQRLQRSGPETAPAS